MIYLGNNEIQGIKLGNDDIAGIYVGDNQIYPTTVSAWSVSPSAITISSSGDTERIKIEALDSWTISSSENWITFSQNSGDSGRTRITATIAANDSTARTATITVEDTGQTTAFTINVSQEALPFSVSPSALTAGISAETINLTISSPLAWTATSSESWAVLSTGSGLNGITTITVSVPDYAGDSARTATITVTNGTDTSAITMTQKAAELPTNTFLINYNAKEYDPATHTIPQTSGQTFNEDMVLNEGVTSYTANHITVDGQHYERYWNNGGDNPFNLDQNTPCTIIAKTSKGLDASGEHSLMSCRSTYGRINWILFNGGNGADNNTVFMHNSNRYASQTPSITLTDEPNIWAIRINNGSGYAQSYTDNTTGTTQSVRYDGNAAGIGIFTDSYDSAGFELWRGDFYWIYMSKEALTDDEIAAVINYNEDM